jgi:hypothetical protein
VTPGVSTIILNGAANSTQTFIGDNTFNNLTFENTGARTVRFAGDTTQTISGTWTAKGSQSNLLSLALKSGDSGSWSIRPAAWDVRYVNVKNSINLGINRIDPANSVDGGGNTNWFAPKVVPVTPITAIVDIGGTITKGISAVTKSVGDIVGGLVQGVVDIITQSGLANVIQEVYENIVQAIAVTSTAIRNALSVIGLTPEAASSIATATVAVSTALVASVLAPAMATGSLANIGEIFHSVWQPIANLVTGKRRKNWGRIIEEGTGAPIMNTKINLVKVYRESPTVMYESQKVVASTFTDKLGKYGFIAEPGKYKLEIVKTDYSVVDTNSFLDFYHTNTLFEVKDYKQGLVIKDVALSSASKNLEKMFKLTHFTQILSKILSYASFVFLIFGTITIIPVVTQKLSLMNIVIVAAYVFLWGLNGKNLMKKSPWGTVVDKSKNTNLPLVLVRVIDKKTGQLVRTTVSNESGRFSTFIDKGNYEIRALKSGYVLDNPINYTVGKERSTLSKKIEMRPE